VLKLLQGVPPFPFQTRFRSYSFAIDDKTVQKLANEDNDLKPFWDSTLKGASASEICQN
jgi:hypothetical protein